MSMRIDLLKNSEKRYQGPVSGRFIGFLSIFSLLATVLLIASYVLFSMYLRKGQLEWARDSWDFLEPRYKNLIEIRKSTAEIENLLEELKGWSNSSLPASDLLSEFQLINPDTIQFLRLNLRDSIREPKGAPPEGEKVAAYRICRLSISGLSHGNQSESAVIDLIADLRQIADTNTFFNTVTLNAMQKEEVSATTRSFSISAEGSSREMK